MSTAAPPAPTTVDRPRVSLPPLLAPPRRAPWGALDIALAVIALSALLWMVTAARPRLAEREVHKTLEAALERLHRGELDHLRRELAFSRDAAAVLPDAPPEATVRIRTGVFEGRPNYFAEICMGGVCYGRTARGPLGAARIASVGQISASSR